MEILPTTLVEQPDQVLEVVVDELLGDIRGVRQVRTAVDLQQPHVQVGVDHHVVAQGLERVVAALEGLEARLDAHADDALDLLVDVLH